MDYKWKLTFVLNGARCKSNFTYYNWVVKPLPNKSGKPRVRFSLMFTRSRYYDYWRVLDLAEMKVSRILDAMAPGLFYNLGYPFFPTISDLELTLENEQELRVARQKIPSCSSFRFKYNLLLDKVSFKATLRHNSKIVKSSDKEILRHFLLLYRRGLSYEDEFDKFFTLWRSFNSLYNHFCSGTSETQRIRQILQRLDAKDVAYIVGTYSKVPSSSEVRLLLARSGNDLFKYLASRNLVDNRGRNRSLELCRATSTGQQSNILEKAMLCLYVVRCNFAHGSDSQIVKDQRLFQVSSTLLAALLMCLESKLV